MDEDLFIALPQQILPLGGEAAGSRLARFVAFRVNGEEVQTRLELGHVTRLELDHLTRLELNHVMRIEFDHVTRLELDHVTRRSSLAT